jgi:hypothetical protein
MTTNIYDQINLFQGLIPSSNYFNVELDNDVSGNPIYVGYSAVPGAAVTDFSWYIIKLTYTLGYLTSVEVPLLGPNFNYQFSSRATYF